MFQQQDQLSHLVEYNSLESLSQEKYQEGRKTRLQLAQINELSVLVSAIVLCRNNGNWGYNHPLEEFLAFLDPRDKISLNFSI